VKSISQEDDQIPPEAAAAYRLAMFALERARLARSRYGADTLMQMADEYFKKAGTLGWRLPERIP
jgi:hypothetical protein